MNELYRSHNTNMFHRSACHHAKFAHRWVWADDKTLDEVALTARDYSLFACLVCDPLEMRRKAHK